MRCMAAAQNVARDHGSCLGSAAPLGEGRPRRLITRRSLIGGLAAWPAAAALGAGAWAGAAIAPADLLTFFDTLALQRSVGRGESRPGIVRKWTEAVAVRVRGVAAAPYQDSIRAMLAEVSALAGLDFALATPDGATANLITLYYLSRREIGRLYPRARAVCFTQARGQGGHIHTGEVRIGADFEDCLHHEFMHALGFDNHWEGRRFGLFAPSALADRFGHERTREFSDWDRLAIRLLYDLRLEAGLARAPALEVARRLVPELLTA